MIDNSMSELIDSIIDRDIEKVKYLLEQGADPNSVIDASGLSAMHFACQSTVGIFKCLLDFGGSIFNRDIDGVSVIDYARNTPEIYALIRSEAIFDGTIN